jgi:hypothetical protein
MRQAVADRNVEPLCLIPKQKRSSAAARRNIEIGVALIGTLAGDAVERHFEALRRSRRRTSVRRN